MCRPQYQCWQFSMKILTLCQKMNIRTLTEPTVYTNKQTFVSDNLLLHQCYDKENPNIGKYQWTYTHFLTCEEKDILIITFKNLSENKFNLIKFYGFSYLFFENNCNHFHVNEMDNICVPWSSRWNRHIHVSDQIEFTEPCSCLS